MTQKVDFLCTRGALTHAFSFAHTNKMIIAKRIRQTQQQQHIAG